MPTITASDGTRLHYEETGRGVPIVFVHEFAGDHRSFEPQMRFFSRSHRCIAFDARGYLPSDVPDAPEAYGQDTARDDVVAVLDGLGLEKAHIVGHSMGAYTALHVAIHHPGRCLSVAAIGCGWGSNPDEREERAAMCADIARMFRVEAMDEAAARYARYPMRKAFEAKDPRGFAEFEKTLADHSATGLALTMSQVQGQRPTLWDMEEALSRLEVPLLVIVGDEDDPCLDGSVFLKRTAPMAALVVVPRSGHTLTLEEPAAVNRALAELFRAVAEGAWMAHRREP